MHISYRHQHWGNIRVKKLSSVNVNFSAYFHKFLWLSAVWQTVVRSRHRGIECPPGEQLLDLLVHLRSTLSSKRLIIQFSIQAGWVVTGWLFQKTRRPRLSVESRGIADHCPPIDFAFVAETFADTLLCVPGHTALYPRTHWGHSPDKSGHWTQEYGELCPNLVWLKFSAVLLTIIESMNL